MVRTFIRSIGLPVLALFAGVAVFGMASTGVQAQGAKRAIEQVKGDVYLFRNNFHNAMFVVTNDGIVVTDPINAEAVGWLKAELKKRFNKPVTHMIYSHSHDDHNSGGQAWGAGIEVIAHENLSKNLNSGQTAAPTKTYKDGYTLKAGGKTFEIKYLGVGHGDDMSAIVVRPENVGFVVDVISPGRLPFRDFPRTDIAGLLSQIKAVEALNFDIMAAGHSKIGKHSDARDTRVYIENLMAAVTTELKAGKSVDDVVKSVKMEDYKGWISYKQFLELNVRGMVKWLKDSGKV
ncbi:MAG: MBL fold metallo-hydrolase [Proteobacteria bacterium]|nr:MBL fold metallo-hydrolase [Pseudomonadota bacterium]